MEANSPRTRGLRTPALRRGKTSDKQLQVQDRLAELVSDSNDTCTRQKPVSQLGHRLRRKLEQEKLWRYALINEHNRLTPAVKGKEDELKQLQESMEAMSDHPAYNNEDTYTKHIWQLENNREKMRMKLTEGQNIQVTYHHICEKLQQEALELHQVLDQCVVAVEQAQADTATKMLQWEGVFADRTPNQDLMRQVEHGTMEKRRAMASELQELSSALKELKEQMEASRRLSPRAQSRLRGRDSDEEESDSVSVRASDHQCDAVCGASGRDRKQVELLSDSADIQQTTAEQLLSELTYQDELIGQETKTLADLELRYSELKFSEKSSATRCDKLKKQIQAKLKLKVKCVEGQLAHLKQSQNLLDVGERGVDNLYLKISSMSVKGLSSETFTDCVDKLKDIGVLLSTLLQNAPMQEPKISSLNQEQIFNLVENVNMMEPRNNKRPTSPRAHLADTLQLGDDEEECSPSRDEIKRCSSTLIESQQSKKSSRRTRL